MDIAMYAFNGLLIGVVISLVAYNWVVGRRLEAKDGKLHDALQDRIKKLAEIHNAHQATIAELDSKISAINMQVQAVKLGQISNSKTR